MFWNTKIWLHIIACHLDSSLSNLLPNNWTGHTGITSCFYQAYSDNSLDTSVILLPRMYLGWMHIGHGGNPNSLLFLLLVVQCSPPTSPPSKCLCECAWEENICWVKIYLFETLSQHCPVFVWQSFHFVIDYILVGWIKHLTCTRTQWDGALSFI